MQPPPDISFFWQGIPCKATAQTRRHAGRRTYRTQRNKLAMATLRAIVERWAPARPFQGPVKVRACFTFPVPAGHRQIVTWRAKRPDGDNLTKDLLDALQRSGYYEDDRQVALLQVAKFTGPIPGLFLEVAPLPPFPDQEALP